MWAVGMVFLEPYVDHMLLAVNITGDTTPLDELFLQRANKTFNMRFVFGCSWPGQIMRNGLGVHQLAKSPEVLAAVVGEDRFGKSELLDGFGPGNRCLA